MHEIVIDGKTYISTKRAAELTKYTKDYVGQLARGGRIAARLVGRNWYVEERAILIHAGLAQDEHEEYAASVPTDEAVSSQSFSQSEQENQYTNMESGSSDLVTANYESIDDQHEASGNYEIPQTEVESESHVVEDQMKGQTTSVLYESDDRDLLPPLSQHPTFESEQSLEEEVVTLRRGIDHRNAMHQREQVVAASESPEEQFSEAEQVTKISHSYSEEQYELPTRSTSRLFPGAIVFGGLVLFILGGLALSIILYPSAISKSQEYTRSDQESTPLEIRDENQSASTISSMFKNEFEYTRE